ncbi:hypothetical protein HXX76_008841 [Chlamydomonas incerta]|uniref:Sulfotransferase n=1 Tax=Chlamydomonas incerta TaxID=51695 RepID=A0A835SVB7_CHLIN|nr:hypothetical protein HXX76_008841 [Chlamydomonas incerta]|eukprot:KAG2432496.1 hypothetical protein HXX76_008841 [Chlamydomonas incerta]
MRSKLRLALALVACLGIACARAGSITALLQEHIHRFNGTSLLENELKEVLELSRRQLASAAEGKQLSQLLATSNKDDGGAVLEEAERVAEEQPTLPILARRIVFARRLLQFLAQGGSALGDKDEQELLELAKGFYALHVAGVVERGLLEYLHISKSGGTSFSHAAKANGCAMEGGMGQLEELGDLPRWVNGSAFREATGAQRVMWDAYGEVERRTSAATCAARKEHVLGRGHNYVSNEYTLHGGLEDMKQTHVCPQLVNVVTLRNPLKRLESHLHYMLPFMSRSVKRQTKDGAAFARAFCSGRPGVWEAVAPAVADNYNVRSFIGEAAFHSPVGAIGQPHLDLAKSLLVQFDLVLDLDAGEDASSLIMSQGLGWGKTLSEVRARTSKRVTSKLGFSEADCPRDGLAELLPRQQPDLQLYRLGRVLSFLDSLFLDLAREAGQTPQGAAAAAAGGEGGGGGSEERGSPLARFTRCGTLRLQLRETSQPDHQHDEDGAIDEIDEDTDPDLMSWPPLLSTLCVSGVGADVGAGIHTLRLDASVWGLPSLVNCAVAMSGRLPNVRELQLDCWRSAEGDVGSPRAVYTALAVALPRLERLTLPFTSWLPGCEALNGSGITSLGLDMARGPLFVEDSRALTQIRQLTHIELNLQQWPQQWSPESARPLSLWFNQDDEEDFPTDESDALMVAALHPEHAEQLGALRWLLVHAPRTLHSIRIRYLQGLLRPRAPAGDGGAAEDEASAPQIDIRDVVVLFEGGAVAAVEVGRAECEEAGATAMGLDFLAAALLPRLAATGQRQLPLLKFHFIEEYLQHLAECVVSPRRPFARLLRMCERKDIGTLRLADLPSISTAASPAGALQSVVQHLGAPDYLQSGGGRKWLFRLQLSPGPSGDAAAAGGTSGGAGGAGGGDGTVPAAGAGDTVPVATAEWALSRAAHLLWGAATGERGAAAVAAAYELARRARPEEHDSLCRYALQGHFVVLRGPLIQQMLLSGNGTKLLHAWLSGVLNISVRPGGASAAEPAGSVPVAPGPGLAAAGPEAAAEEELLCGAMAVVPAAATAVVGCWTAAEAQRLARAAAAAGGVAAGSLEARAMRMTHKCQLMPELSPLNSVIGMALQEVWDSRARNGLTAGPSNGGGGSGGGGGGAEAGAGAAAGSSTEERGQSAQQQQCAGPSGQGGQTAQDAAAPAQGAGAGSAGKEAAGGARVTPADDLDVAALQKLLALAADVRRGLVEQQPVSRSWLDE